MPKKIKIFIISLMVIIGVAIVVFYLINPNHIPENNYPKITITSVQDSGRDYIEAVWCKKCHFKIDSIKRKGTHAKVNCQYCHGPAYKHTRNPQRYELSINTSKAFCVKCHAKSNVVSPQAIKQIDSLKHNSGSTNCIICHNPHSPLMAAAISRSGETKQVTGAACTICHENINKTVIKGNHKSISCQRCHGQGAEHVLSPSPKNINKPQSREFCGKCHATGKTSARIKQIDMLDHNAEMKCVECHSTHNPSEFK